MKTFFIAVLILLAFDIKAQTSFRVMSYNVENLFDTYDDPEKDDDEFLPSGIRRWTNRRYYHKLQQIAKVITAAGSWETPAVIGLCEVENDSVITDLLTRTPLRNQHYRYCRTQGSDPRGINLALFYQRDKFAYLSHSSIPVRHSGKDPKPTRDILHVSGRVISMDTLDLFVCHFPSRYGGEVESQQHRFDAAQTLRTLCDSIHSIRQTAHIIILGDFNDTPQDHSVEHILGAGQLPREETPFRQNDSLSLYNLFARIPAHPVAGSNKYQGEWSQLDQIIISSNICQPDNSIRLIPENIRIFAPSFLLTNDKTWRGLRPKRTYYGFRYEGGFSDHLPIIADFHIQDRPVTQEIQEIK